jgi:hypothetical protein
MEGRPDVGRDRPMAGGRPPAFGDEDRPRRLTPRTGTPMASAVRRHGGRWRLRQKTHAVRHLQWFWRFWRSCFQAVNEMKFDKASEGKNGVRWRVARAPDIAKGEANPAASTEAGDV